MKWDAIIRKKSPHFIQNNPVAETSSLCLKALRDAALFVKWSIWTRWKLVKKWYPHLVRIIKICGYFDFFEGRNNVDMAEKNIQNSIKEGRVGELYAQKHCAELVNMRIESVVDTSQEKIEGKDFTAAVVVENVQHILNVEVKTVRNFLFRTNDNQEPTGTIGFELYSEKLSVHGWFPKMLHPSDGQAVCPDILMFLLVAYENVFACVAFDNVPALFDRLRAYAKDSGFDLDNLPIKTAARQLSEQQHYIINNMWMVPLRIIEDLATVTMIGDTPRMRPDILSGKERKERICLNSTQWNRYEHLCALSGNRAHLETDSEFIFVGDEAEQVIATVNYNLSVLERINWDHFSMLKYFAKKTKFRSCYEGVMMNMLSHEYPSKKMKGTAYYPMSYGSIFKWCRNHDYNIAESTFFGHIKYMKDFVMLKYSRPPKNSKDPIDIEINKKNKRFKSVGYYTPIKLTRDALLNADCKAQEFVKIKNTSSNVTKKDFLEIRSFEEVNPAYGNDGRRITKVETYVRDTIVKKIYEEVYSHYFITPDKLLNKVTSYIRHSQKFKGLDYNNLKTPDDFKEYVRQRPYYEAIEKYKKKIKRLIALECPDMKIHLISKNDRRWLNANIPDGTYIITLKQVPDQFYAQYHKALLRDKEEERAKRRAKRKAKKAAPEQNNQ